MTLFKQRLLKFALAMTALSLPGLAQTGSEHWVTTWTTANLQPPTARPTSVGQPLPAAQQALLGFNNQTIRMIVPVTGGGRRVRLHFSNLYGTTPLTIGSAHVALRAKDSAIAAGSDRALSFSGQAGFIIPAGAVAVSDAVDLVVAPLSDLAVSVFVPKPTGAPTVHSVGLHTTYISKQGDVTGDASIADAATTVSWYWLSSVEVLAAPDTAAILAFGDSITDGAASTPDTNSSWPSQLARRLAANPSTAHMAVLNQGISGNRLLRDGVGANALARFDEDVISQAGVKWLIVLEGINDIGRGSGPNANPDEGVTAQELTGAYRQMIERAHARGIKVAGATLTPYRGARYFSDKGETIRTAVNDWIRSAGAFDAVIDFDAATRDPNHPQTLRPDYDSGDHLHPKDGGYKAMADAIDLAIFSAPPASAQAR